MSKSACNVNRINESEPIARFNIKYLLYLYGYLICIAIYIKADAENIRVELSEYSRTEITLQKTPRL